jgi:hypothetical protein
MPRCIREESTSTGVDVNVEVLGSKDVAWINLALDRVQWRALTGTLTNFRSL